MRTLLSVQGMRSADCAEVLQRELRAVPGVRSARVSFASAQAAVSHGKKVSREDLVAAVHRAGYAAAEPGVSDAPVLSVRLLVAGLLGVVVFLLAVASVYTDVAPLLGVAQLVLTLVVFVLGSMVFRRGVHTVMRTGHPSADTLVALGASLLFVYSASAVVHWLRGGVYDGSQVHFASAALLVVFVVVGRALETYAQRSLGQELHSLLAHAPVTARTFVDNREEEVPVEEVRVGDTLKVKPGERIPVDGVVLVGATRVDERVLTGASVSVKKTIRDVVYAGTMNKSGMFLLRATHVGEDTALSRVLAHVMEAQRSPAPLQRVADRAASMLVPAAFVLAVLTFVFWVFFPPVFVSVPLVFALLAAVSVLVVASPAAFSLAVPTAVHAGTGVLGASGVLCADAEVLQRLGEVRTVVFTAHGGLLAGPPEVQSVRAYYDIGEESALRYAASLASVSAHPVDAAIVAYAERKHIGFGPPRAFEHVPGKGVRGKVEGRKIVLGSLTFFQEEGIGVYDVRERIPELARSLQSPVLLAVEGRLAALIGVARPVAPHAKEAIAALHARGVETAFVSGDHHEVADAIARAAGIPLVRAGLSPAEKRAEVAKWKRKRTLAVVGDASLDASLLSVADVGVLFGPGDPPRPGSRLVRFLHGDMRVLDAAMVLSRRVARVMRQNLFWAAGYHVVLLPVAMGVLVPLTGWLLPPVVAGVLMTAASFSVVLNSLRVRSAKAINT